MGFVLGMKLLCIGFYKCVSPGKFDWIKVENPCIRASIRTRINGFIVYPLYYALG